jgi:hypothetical protein
VWGIGVTLYEAASARTAFGPADDAEATVLDGGGFLQLLRPAAPLRRWRPRLPRELTSVIEECLDPEPSGRPSLPRLRAVLRAATMESTWLAEVNAVGASE